MNDEALIQAVRDGDERAIAQGYLRISKGDGRYTRRQDAPKGWEFNGAVYVIDAEAIRREEISQTTQVSAVHQSH